MKAGPLPPTGYVCPQLGTVAPAASPIPEAIDRTDVDAHAEMKLYRDQPVSNPGFDELRQVSGKVRGQRRVFVNENVAVADAKRRQPALTDPPVDGGPRDAATPCDLADDSFVSCVSPTSAPIG